MANSAVRGRVLDNLGAPQPDLTVTAFDADVWPFRDRLGSAVTDGAGAFTISYSPSVYGPAERQPDIAVEVTRGSSVLYRTREFGDVKDPTLDLGALVLHGHNISVTGRVLDENGVPVAGLVVVARDIDIGSADDVLGRAPTDGNGRFTINYSPAAYWGANDHNPDIVVTVLDRVGIRTLAETTEAGDVQAAVFIAGDIRVSRAVADGVVATLGGSVASRLTTGNAVAPLIDNEAACRDMVAAIDAATTSIELCQLHWEPGFVATFTGERVATNETRPDVTLVDAILRANRRGVVVRILLNEHAVVPDTVDEIRDHFSAAGSNTVSVRAFPLRIDTLHAKFLVVDRSAAWIIGSPFEQGYWDTTGHQADEPRRGGGATGIGIRPIHEVSVKLRGPSVAHVFELFVQLWNRESAKLNGADTLTTISPPAAAGGQAVQIVRTLPRGAVPGSPQGEEGVLESYQRAFGAAEDFIYIENQYFSARVIQDALIRVLRDKAGVQVILLLNESPDIPTYRMWQNRRLRTIGTTNPRVGAFATWTAGIAAGRVSVQQGYVHSKVAIVDDKWATIGTANCDGISLSGSEELGLGRHRNLELNAVMIDGSSGQPATGDVRRFREALWAHHLGVAATSRPAGGWLGLWTGRAAANVASLNAANPTMTGRVLPYRAESGEAAQLRAMGVDPSRLTVIG